MDNYRRPMYTRYNRNMGQYQSPQCGCGAAPAAEERTMDHCDKDLYDKDHCEKERCDKDFFDKCLDKFPLAMAYVPCQKWRKVMDASAGLAAGTIFQELNLPWYGDRNMCGMRGGRYDK
jgi:hypothetical protein